MNPLNWLTGRFYPMIPGLSWISRINKPVVRALVGIVVLVVLLLLLAWILIGLVPLVPGRFWQLAGLCLLAFGVLWWFLVGARRYSRRGFSNKRIGDLGPGNPEDEKEPLERMRAAIAEAKGTIQRSPDIAGGRHPLYRVPWMMFVGDDAADVSGVLNAASRVSPFPPPAAAQDPQQPWRWWFFKSVIAIEMHPRLVCEPGARLERGLWYQALTLLATERDKLALNGIVVCVGASTLLAGPEQAKAVGIRLRRLVDEAMEHLQVRIPVYFLVTGLERQHGYAEFRAALPDEAFAQALGFRLPETEVVNAATSSKLDEIMAPISERLHALRQTILRSQPTVQQRRGVFEFVQTIPRLENGLRVFVNQLLEDNPFQRTPRWRGLYFTGAADAAHPGGAFVADLFTRFLPADQPLATPSVKGSAGKMVGAGLGVAAMLGLSAYLSYGLFAASQDDTELRAQTRVACQERQGSGAGGRIAWVAACGRTIQQLEAAKAGTSLGFGIRRADRDIEGLKNQVVEEFSRLILAPYDQMLDTDLVRGDTGIDHTLAVAQRLRLLEDCRKQREECQEMGKFNVVFDERSRLFAPFRSGEMDARVDAERADALFETYLGYLRWQKRKTLNDEQQRLEREFSRISGRYRPSAADFEAWSQQRSPGVTLQEFWLPEDRVVGVEAGSLPSIPGAYTRPAWDGVVRPWLDAAAEFLPDGEEVGTAFRTSYAEAYFLAWAGFLSRFGEGATLWRGHERELAQRAAGENNPYRFFFDSIEHHLYGLPLKLGAGQRWGIAWAEVKADWLRGWRPIGRFVGDTVASWFGSGDRIDPPPWLAAVQDTQRKVLAGQEAQFAKAYLALESDASGQETYRVVSDFYLAQGRPGDGPAAEYGQLLQAVEKPDERYATQFKSEDLAAWSVVQGPVRLLLQLSVHRAAEYVQQRWRDSVVQPMAALPPGEQINTLYGAQGKLNAFVNDWLKPFITEAERTPVSVAGVSMPLSDGFAAMVGGQRQAAPMLGEIKPFLAGTFAFSGPSQAGGLREAQEGTAVEVVCQERIYRAVSNAPSLAEARTSVFWSPASCLEARVRISLSPPDALDTMMSGGVQAGGAEAAAPVAAAPEPSLSLTRIYADVDGFRELVEDFEDGSQTYALAEFRDAYSPAQWSELVPQLRAAGFSSVRVNLHIDPSDELRRYFAARERPTSVPTSIID